MKTITYREIIGLAAGLYLGLAGVAQAQPVERYVSLDVHNPRAFVSALDAFRDSGAMDGSTTSLWAAMFGGSSPVSHVIVIGYDGYEEMQSIDERVQPSKEWDDYQEARAGTSDVLALSMGVQQIVDGDGWHNHGAAMVFNMTVSDPARYAQAFTRLIESSENPGSVRLIQMRAGGEGASHIAAITAPDFATLNNYMDELFASREYTHFADEVRSIRRIIDTSIYRRVRTWDN